MHTCRRHSHAGRPHHLTTDQGLRGTKSHSRSHHWLHQRHWRLYNGKLQQKHITKITKKKSIVRNERRSRFNIKKLYKTKEENLFYVLYHSHWRALWPSRSLLETAHHNRSVNVVHLLLLVCGGSSMSVCMCCHCCGRMLHKGKQKIINRIITG